MESNGYYHARYMEKAIIPSKLRLKIREAVKFLRAHPEIEFDAIAFRGVSGLLYGPPIALRLKKEMLLVRKPDDGSHSMREKRFVEGWKYTKRYLIVDDFSCYGETARAIVDKIKDFSGGAVCVGLLQVAPEVEGNVGTHPDIGNEEEVNFIYPVRFKR